MPVIVAGLVAAAAYSWFATVPAPFSRGAQLWTALPLATVAIVVARVRPAAREPSSGRARAWVLGAVLLVALELANLFATPRGAHPTLSSIVGPIEGHHLARATMFLAWLALGAWLLSRVRHRR